MKAVRSTLITKYILYIQNTAPSVTSFCIRLVTFIFRMNIIWPQEGGEEDLFSRQDEMTKCFICALRPEGQRRCPGSIYYATPQKINTKKMLKEYIKKFHGGNRDVINYVNSTIYISNYKVQTQGSKRVGCTMCEELFTC